MKHLPNCDCGKVMHYAIMELKKHRKCPDCNHRLDGTDTDCIDYLIAKFSGKLHKGGIK